MASGALKKLPLAGSQKNPDQIGEHLDDLKTSDIVLAIVGHAGAGPTWVAQQLGDELSSRGYDPRIVPVSKALHKLAEQIGISSSSSGSKLDIATQRQNEGDALRTKYGSSITAGIAISEIASVRKELGASTTKPLAFIVDQLKHPDEVSALRSVYGRAFYLVGVLCGYDERLARLLIKFKDHPGTAESKRTAVQEFMKRDSSGLVDEGQHVAKTLHLADFFVSNANGNPSDHLGRFAAIITGTSIARPTRDERGMYAAWGAGLRSSCLSRHVGAALLAKNGEVLSTGTNDVPKAGGGLYEEGATNDRRCFQTHKDANGVDQPGYCRNDAEKDVIYKDAWKMLSDKKVLAADVTPQQVRKALEGTRIRDILEFSRAVHAEMDAVVALARLGGSSSAGTTMYCTTFPCHSCARHIVAAGVAEVVYVEPYSKSLAERLHGDSVVVSELPVSNNNKVTFRLFSGVAPRRFGALFEKRREEKDSDGKSVTDIDGHGVLSDTIFRKSFLDLENDIATKLANLAAEIPT